MEWLIGWTWVMNSLGQSEADEWNSPTRPGPHLDHMAGVGCIKTAMLKVTGRETRCCLVTEQWN